MSRLAFEVIELPGLKSIPAWAGWPAGTGRVSNCCHHADLYLLAEWAQELCIALILDPERLYRESRQLRQVCIRPANNDPNSLSGSRLVAT